MNQPNIELIAFVRAIAVHSQHPGSRRSRPISWWKPVLEKLLGTQLKLGEIRTAMLAAGVRVGSDGESTNLLAKESLRRASVVMPDLVREDAETGMVERVEVKS